MQIIYLDTTAGNWYDERGERFRSNQPSMAFQTQDKIQIITVSSVPAAETETVNPATDWPRDTTWGGMAARIAVDNDTVHRLKGTVASEIPAGAIASIEATIPNASQALIPEAGPLTIYTASGDAECVSYDSRKISGTAVTFTLVSGATVVNTYPAGSVLDCAQNPFCAATMDIAASDSAQGVFAFDLIVDSRRLREEMLYRSVDRLPVKGLELLFYRETEAADVPVRAFLLSSFSIAGLINDVNYSPEIPDSEFSSRLKRLLAAGEEVQYSTDGTTWVDPEDAGDDLYVYRYYRTRNALVLGEWSEPIPLIAGPQGPQGPAADLSEVEARLDALETAVGNVSTTMAAIIGTEG